MAGGGGGGGASERRLKKAMDKLYHFPKPTSSSSSSFTSSWGMGRGRGRGPEVGRRLGMERGSRMPPQLAAMSALAPPPPCRPWDRGDLMRRLASFKAMTWFAKPKVISPVNCARRGWTNIEPDVITCEACRARLLFSTPSSWTPQQVEKAAAVFSLKLDTAHKLLCPWIDNICDESLALFPPTPPPVLVENYKECLSSLLRLSALPRISCSALEYMKKRSPQLEQFLSEPFSSSIVLKGGFVLTEDSTSKDVDDAFQDADIYYQALKVISLCGWEPRLLPYAVDRGPKSPPDANATSTSNRSEQIHNTKEDRVTVYSPKGVDGAEGVADATQGDQQYDPSSVVLDCRFCGACVALWPFSIVERPLELFKLMADSNRQSEQNNGCANLVGGVEPSKAANVGFNFTIAGGPLATRQNFRPRVSFPVVSRLLKAELSSYGKSLSSETQSDGFVSEGSGSLKRKRSTDELLISESDHVSAHRSSSADADTPTEGTKHDQEEDNSEKSNANLDIVTQGEQECSHSDKNKDADTEESSHGEPGTGADTSKIAGSMTATLDAILTNKDAEPNQDSSESEFTIRRTCKAPSNDQNIVEVPVSIFKPIEVTTITQSSFNKEKGANLASGRRALYDRMDEFDPIKQHRTFCPWIAPDDGEALPGWKLTVLALLSQEKRSNGDSQVEVQTSLLDDEDDPLTSVRKLFMSPPSKMLKSTQHAEKS